jgi:hypothetical protein
LAIKAGETRVFRFSPKETRTYHLATSGNSDTVMVLFAVTPSGNVQIAADDDSGTDANASIEMPLSSGRDYQIGVRLYYAGTASETTLTIR